jgi:hypothetical protein
MFQLATEEGSHLITLLDVLQGLSDEAIFPHADIDVCFVLRSVVE